MDDLLEKSLERIAAASGALIEGLEVQLRRRNHPLLLNLPVSERFTTAAA